MIGLAEVRESRRGKAGVTLVHIPTGCHVTVDSARSRAANRVAGMRLLKSRLSNWEKFQPKG